MSANRQIIRAKRAEARSRALAKPLLNWFERFAMRELRGMKGEIEEAVKHKEKREELKKAKLTSAEAELLRLLQRYGLRSLIDDGKDTASGLGGRFVMRPEVLDEFNNMLAENVKQIASNHKRLIRERMRDIIKSQLEQDRIPSTNMISQQLAREIKDPTSDRRIVSFEQAQRIARTEIGAAQNIGIKTAYSEVGVDAVEWLAQRDRRSGERMHWMMNDHKPILVIDMNGNNKLKWFKLPRGERCPYPHWAGLSVGERVN